MEASRCSASTGAPAGMYWSATSEHWRLLYQFSEEKAAENYAAGMLRAVCLDPVKIGETMQSEDAFYYDGEKWQEQQPPVTLTAVKILAETEEQAGQA